MVSRRGFSGVLAGLRLVSARLLRTCHSVRMASEQHLGFWKMGIVRSEDILYRGGVFFFPDFIMSCFRFRTGGV